MKNLQLISLLIILTVSACSSQSNQVKNNDILTDTVFTQNDTLPIWIITISGWGDPSIEEANKRMNAYKAIAEKWKINIEFSSRLGTLQSYKHAPSVVKEIMEHNDKTFAVYEKMLGKDWQARFIQKVEIKQ